MVNVIVPGPGSAIRNPALGAPQLDHQHRMLVDHWGSDIVEE